MDAWEPARDAWRDYLTTLPDPEDRGRPAVRKAHERWSYLEERLAKSG
jgi:hypothetical protein